MGEKNINLPNCVLSVT